MISKPSNENTIICFKDKPKDGFSYNSEFLSTSITKKYNINITDAKMKLDSFPKEYTIENKSIPEIVKDLKKYRRKLSWYGCG